MSLCLKIHKFLSKNTLSILLLLSIIFLKNNVSAQQTIILDYNKNHYDLQSNLTWLEDPTGQLTLQEITANPKLYNFITSKTLLPPLKNTSSTFWFKFKFSNPDQTPQEWFFQSDYYSMDIFNWYYKSTNGNYQQDKLGLKDPFSQRKIKQRNPTIKIILPASTDTIFYLQIKSARTPITPQFNLFKESLIIDKSLSEHFFLVSFWGQCF